MKTLVICPFCKDFQDAVEQRVGPQFIVYRLSCGHEVTMAIPNSRLITYTRIKGVH